MAETEATEVPRRSASVWEDFVDIFYAPTEVFSRRLGGKFGLALLAVTLVLAILAVPVQVAIASALEGDMQRALESMGPEARQGAAAFDPTAPIATLLGVVGTLFLIPVGVFATGLAIWVISRLFDATFPVAVAVMIATYSVFPRVLQSVATIVQGQFIEPNSLAGFSLGPARFMDVEATEPVLMAIAGRLDLFAIWSTVLVAIGLYVAGKVPKGRAVVVAVLVWILALGPTLAGVLFRPG
jgi:hypothetical protein